ncbi:hypothetical protein ACIODS_32660 [Micromonospora chalcea]|uniref:hypothetical protein n=1 Tax=Micromonospora chalcea TaxID=1874 RepID=UPI0037F90891
MDIRVDQALHGMAASFEDRLDEVLDVEAGLRDVLLETQHMQLADNLDDVLDVEAGLAHVLAKDGKAQDEDRVVKVFEEWARAAASGAVVFIPGLGGFDPTVLARLATEAIRRKQKPELDTFERVRRLALRINGVLAAVEEETKPRVHPLDEADFTELLIDAQERIVDLHALGDELEHGNVGLDDALQTVRRTALALLDLHQLLERIQRMDQGLLKPNPIRPSMMTFATDVSNLVEPIRRLFDPSDDTVEALR